MATAKEPDGLLRVDSTRTARKSATRPPRTDFGGPTAAVGRFRNVVMIATQASSCVRNRAAPARACPMLLSKAGTHARCRPARHHPVYLRSALRRCTEPPRSALTGPTPFPFRGCRRLGARSRPNSPMRNANQQNERAECGIVRGRSEARSQAFRRTRSRADRSGAKPRRREHDVRRQEVTRVCSDAILHCTTAQRLLCAAMLQWVQHAPFNRLATGAT